MPVIGGKRVLARQRPLSSFGNELSDVLRRVVSAQSLLELNIGKFVGIWVPSWRSLADNSGWDAHHQRPLGDVPRHDCHCGDCRVISHAQTAQNLRARAYIYTGTNRWYATAPVP